MAEPRRLTLVLCYRQRVLCLKVPSDPGWAAEALRNLDAVLVDHAHCEMKAASNALSLAARHPVSLALVRALTDLAREEIEHFQRVLGFLEARGLPLGPPVVDTYAADLRKACGALPRKDAPPPIVDRLLVSALIEARSCERFKLLMAALGPLRDPELYAFYAELFAAEARHYQVLVDLAIEAAEGDAAGVLLRLALLSDREGEIVRALGLSTSHDRAEGRAPP